MRKPITTIKDAKNVAEADVTFCELISLLVMVGYRAPVPKQPDVGDSPLGDIIGALEDLAAAAAVGNNKGFGFIRIGLKCNQDLVLRRNRTKNKIS